MATKTFGDVVQLVNRLQRTCGDLGDNAASDGSLWSLLPSIVVVGGQSSGKSSVLEAVVGTDFLPRGTGIVTKRPLVLQLVHIEDPHMRPFGEFLHTGPNKRFWDFGLIRQEIEHETIRHLSKTRRTVSPYPIQLAIYSPNVPNLTMIDMPGLTKVPLEGQPHSIVRELEDMARNYIKSENAVILAVTPANADLATSDALQLARQVDPRGERTIGVLTKLDIMDRGTNARDVLSGKAIRLHHGWVGIVNRGQRDINNNMSMPEARAREAAFFQQAREYAGLHNLGTGVLAGKLERQLIAAIQAQLPHIQASIDSGRVHLTLAIWARLTHMQTPIDSRIVAARKELDSLGGPVAESRGRRIHLILTLARQFEDAFNAAVDGGKDGGERITSVFENRLSTGLRRLNFSRELAPDNVQHVVETADGYQPHLVAPELGYRRLLQLCLSKFKEPAETATDEVHAILCRIMSATLAECLPLQRYSTLKREIATTASAALSSMCGTALAMVDTMVEMERSYLTAEVFREILASERATDELSAHVNTGLVLTLDGRTMADVIADGPEEERHLRTIAAHTSAYITHVRRQLKHTLPKGIVHCLVVQSKKQLLAELHEAVAEAEDGDLLRLLAEDEEVGRRRAVLTDRLTLLSRAKAELIDANY